MTLATVQSSIKATDKQWNNLHGKAVESRVFLCREAATLFGLRQRTRRRKGDLTNSFSIGGINIVDLRQMNSVNPAQITTSLSHISRMVVLVSHYLALRLPAEIVVPHRGHPLPAIFTPSASYLPRRHDSSPSLSPSHSITSHSLTPRSADANAGPRPRPLFVDRSLPKLAKEDPTSYALFIEGVSLLAWDISWLCRTQGLHLGSESWEDVCDIGRNLWQLLVAPPAFLKALSNRENPQSPSPSRQDKDGPEKGNGDINISTNGNPRNNLRRSRSLPILGHYSHGSAHSFLGSVEGVEFMKTWKLPSPVKIADKLKSTLLGEMANAEWELLGEDEWEEEAKRVNDESPERGGMVLLK
ncbi:hypothetical protein FQN49_008546 [Arthroderma sp. PD_2]|nr:hypothetical protein FQN49_008546 [Arthroderma sp. PD_2]